VTPFIESVLYNIKWSHIVTPFIESSDDYQSSDD